MPTSKSLFPTSQAELIKMARGSRTKTDFARLLEVSRSGLSRYESEELGAPPRVITRCLRAIATQLSDQDVKDDPLDRAIQMSKDVTRQLEQAVAKRAS